MRSLICTDELATDVKGAKALLERHNEHRVKIDAINNALQVGHLLLLYLLFLILYG